MQIQLFENATIKETRSIEEIQNKISKKILLNTFLWNKELNNRLKFFNTFVNMNETISNRTVLEKTKVHFD